MKDTFGKECWKRAKYYQGENAQLKIENSYHSDHTIYQGNCITCAEWEDTDRENETLKAELEISQKDVKQIMENWNDAVNQATGFKADLAQLQEDFEGEVKENDARLIELNKCRAALKKIKNGSDYCVCTDFQQCAGCIAAETLSDISGKGEK